MGSNFWKVQSVQAAIIHPADQAAPPVRSGKPSSIWLTRPLCPFSLASHHPSAQPGCLVRPADQATPPVRFGQPSFVQQTRPLCPFGPGSHHPSGRPGHSGPNVRSIKPLRPFGPANHRPLANQPSRSARRSEQPSSVRPTRPLCPSTLERSRQSHAKQQPYSPATWCGPLSYDTFMLCNGQVTTTNCKGIRGTLIQSN